jgi:hypothetical protein
MEDDFRDFRTAENVKEVKERKMLPECQKAVNHRILVMNINGTTQHDCLDFSSHISLSKSVK